MSFGVWFIIKSAFGMHVTKEDECKGVDVSECGIEAYPEFTKR